MKTQGGLRFIIILLVLGILTYLTINGSPTLGIPGVNDIRLGIDIRGGVYAQFYPDVPIEEITQTQVDAARRIIEERLDNKGIFDKNLTAEYDKKRIIVEIPWKPGEAEFDPQATINELGQTALLTFQEVDDELVDENGRYLPTGKIILQGDDVKEAAPQRLQDTGDIVVGLTLTSDAADRFAEATERLVEKPIAIFMDNNLISAPIVSQKITGGSAYITLGDLSYQEKIDQARRLAETINAGALPFGLVTKDLKTISPILGEGALKVAINAGIVAFFLVCLFMLLYYRLPGILANIALFWLVILQLLAISALRVSLTLPGIAGIILSIGMGVDSNVIIFERIKEELKSGKTLGAAIDNGFKRAFTAILDSNITTLISAAILYWLGTGPIKGFAVTLIIGVLLSFFTAVTASRIMLKSVSSMDFAKHHWLYGA